MNSWDEENNGRGKDVIKIRQQRSDTAHLQGEEKLHDQEILYKFQFLFFDTSHQRLQIRMHGRKHGLQAYHLDLQAHMKL